MSKVEKVIKYIKGFLVYLGGIKWEHWPKMWQPNNLLLLLFHLLLLRHQILLAYFIFLTGVKSLFIYYVNLT